MRVSDERLMRQCAIADARLATNAGLNSIDEYALDLRDARARVAKLEAELAQQKRMHEHEAKWRKAYQEAKGKMYEAGGEMLEFAMNNMPCDEGHLDSWFRQSYVHRDAHDNLRAELEAQLAEARRDGERLDFLIERFQEVSHRVVDALGISTDEHFKDVGDGEMEIDWRAAIAAAAAEGEKG